MKLLKALLAAVVTIAIGLSGALIAPSVASAATTDADFDLITQRLQGQYLEQGDQFQIASLIYLAKVSEAESYASSLKSDGSWADVNYADTTSSANTAVWQPYLALYRMVAMAEAYRDPTNAGYNDPGLITALNNSLTYWDSVNPTSSNWWENEIGKSMAMGRVAIFVGDKLSPAALAVDYKHNTGIKDPAGANGSWRTSNYLMEAVSQRNAANFTSALATLQATVAVDNSGGVNEAVQPDSSLWVHGQLLYNEWYGMSLFQNIAIWADAARGTSFGFSRAALDSIATFILDGTRWMIRGNFGLMITLYKEPMSFEGVDSAASAFLLPLEEMSRADNYNSANYQQLVDNIKGKSPQNGVTGDKYFWRGEFSSHITNDYSIMTRLNSSRSKGGEYRSIFRPAVGNEMYWSANGATDIQVTNHEYTDLGPAYDWLHYPGTTVPQKKIASPDIATNNGSFTGGVSDGTYGLNVQSMNQANTTAKKSYFQFDKEMVALGTNIASTSSAPVQTTVNQVISADNASVDGQPLAVGTDTTMNNVGWAYNDKVGYVFPDDGAIHVANKSQSGSYGDGDPTVTKNAFSLYFDHGTAPTNGSYDYIVLPAKSPAAVEAYSNDPAVSILRNDGVAQAVTDAHLKQTMVVFYSASSVTLADGSVLSADQPSLVMLDQSGSKPKVTVSNPDQPGLQVNISLTKGSDSVHSLVKLGSSANLGKSVSQTLTDTPVVVDDNPLYSASSTASGSSAALAGDNDSTTAWRSAGTNYEWLQYQLQPSSMLTHVDLAWKAGSYATRYVIQSSTDGTTWTDLLTENAGTGAPVSLDVPPTPAKYVRVLALASADGTGYSVTSLSAKASVNLALGQVATASASTSPNTPNLAVDGKTSTVWRGPAATGSTGDQAWLTVDLGTSQSLKAARLIWGANPSATYKIQVSDNGTTWTDAYVTPAATKGGAQKIALNAQGRYVRVQSQTRLGTQAVGASIEEFEVYGDTAILTAPTGPMPSARPNLALGAVTTSDSDYGDPSQVAAFATDGNADTRWASKRNGPSGPTAHSITVDLGSVKAVDQVRSTWESATATDYAIETSTNGTDWTQASHVQKPVTQLVDNITFNSTQARYVRLSGLASTNYGWSIYELEVYGNDAISCTTANSVVFANASGAVAATVAPIAAGDVVTATSLNPGIVTIAGAPTISTSGVVSVPVTGKGSGTAGIRITHSAGTGSAVCSVSVTADTTALQALTTQVESIVSVNYTPHTWAKVVDAYLAAKSALAQSVVEQSDVDADTAALQTAVDELTVRADTTALSSGIDSARAIQRSLYTSSSLALVDASLQTALNVNNDTSQADVDAATAALSNAVAALEPIAAPDSKDLLGATIAAIDGLNESLYTPNSWAAFIAATAGQLDTARAVFADADASAADVASATTGLQQALTLLNARADRTQLDAELGQIAALKQSDYSAASWQLLSQVVSAASALDANASQLDVNAATEALKSAQAALQAAPIVTTDQLTNRSRPSISGSARTGKTVTAGTGSWSVVGATFTYQWVANGKPIAGATGKSFKLTASRGGVRLSVIVTAHSGSSSASATSSAVTVKASSRASITVTDRSISSAQKAKVRVKVIGDGSVQETGRVTIHYGTKTKSVTLHAKNHGTITVVLPKLRKGSYKVWASYAGNSTVVSDRTTTKSLSVKSR